MGLVTPLGIGVADTWRALLAGQFIRDHGRCPLSPSGAPSTSPQQTASRVSELAHVAADEAMFTSGQGADHAGTALVVATSRGPADHWLQSHPDAAVDAFGLSSIAADLHRRYGIRGPVVTVSGACASGLHALIRATLLLQHGDATQALVVAAESSLHPLFLSSFRRLGVLPPPGARCQPFDEDRSGFLCSEAAAAVMIHRTDAPLADDVAVDRVALAGDATHLTGSDPAGTTLRRVLAHVIAGETIDLYHAHGTGTPANDAVEAAAIDAVLAAHRSTPHLYSHKGALGHTVGSAGLLAVVCNVLAHRNGCVPGNVCTDRPIPLANAVLSKDRVNRVVRRSVACAAGFGGATAAVSLRTPTRDVDVPG
jgi:3-oxoacyl-(acyl-carrier-protein) synthase